VKLSASRSQLIGEVIGRQQRVDDAGGRIPVVGAKAVTRGHKARAGVEHFVLGVTGAEFRADRSQAAFKNLTLSSGPIAAARWVVWMMDLSIGSRKSLMEEGA